MCKQGGTKDVWRLGNPCSGDGALTAGMVARQDQRRRRGFWILLAVNLALVLLDGLLTWIHTPDLSNEGNPLVMVLGLGWGALFLANLLAFALLFFSARYAYTRYRTLPREGAVTMAQYISQLFFRRPDRFRWFWYRLPKRWTPLLACFGYGFLPAAMASRAILVCEWAFPLPDFYWNVRRALPLERLDVWVALLLCAVLLVRWFRVEFARAAALES